MNLASIHITDLVAPELQKLVAKTKPEQLARIIRQPLETYTRQYLVNNGTNEKGWPSTHFWESAARQTTATTSGGTVAIEINKVGVRQRAFGGPIKPVNAGALAIPISPESYGHLPREFPNLKLIKTPKGAYLIQYNGPQYGSLRFLFKIVGGVFQEPCPTVVPSVNQLTGVALDAIRRNFPTN